MLSDFSVLPQAQANDPADASCLHWQVELVYTPAVHESWFGELSTGRRRGPFLMPGGFTVHKVGDKLFVAGCLLVFSDNHLFKRQFPQLWGTPSLTPTGAVFTSLGTHRPSHRGSRSATPAAVRARASKPSRRGRPAALGGRCSPWIP